MAFSTKRGRPKLEKPHTDTGTPELVAKRASGVTQEPLDICLEKRLITADLHRCGLHLRWLYTLRYGAPTIRAIPLHHEHGSVTRTDDPTWRKERETDYKIAVATLNHYHAYEAVMRLCVFHDYPRFLNPHLQQAAMLNRRLSDELNNEYQLVIRGLMALQSLWHPTAG